MGQLTEAQNRIEPRLPAISRELAHSLGLTHFFTGIPCKRGHIAERFVCDAACGACKELSAAKYKNSHREEIRARDRAKYAADPEKFRARSIGRWAAGKAQEARKDWLDKRPGYKRQWYSANAEEQRQKSRARWADNPDLYRSFGRNRRARDKAADGFHTGEDVVAIRAKQKDRCAYCRVKLCGGGDVDHIMPLFLGGSNWPKNLQLLCSPCNRTKNASDPIDFAKSLGRLL